MSSQSPSYCQRVSVGGGHRIYHLRSNVLLSLSIVPSLLQETVVAGPPEEVQVRVNTGGSVAGSVSNWKVISPGIVTCPVGGNVK